MLRSCYLTPARLFTDPAAPYVRIRYYRCPPGAKDMPFPYAVQSLNWTNSLRGINGQPVGEIYCPFPKRWSAGATPPTARGLAPCGTADQFQNGAVYDPLANFPRDDWGLLLACGLVIPTEARGDGLDGVGIDKLLYVGPGGLSIGGRCDLGDSAVAFGGLDLGGTVSLTGGLTAPGGLSLGGTVSLNGGLTAPGGLLLGGTVEFGSLAPPGGLSLGGTVDLDSLAPPGGLSLGGNVRLGH